MKEKLEKLVGKRVGIRFASANEGAWGVHDGIIIDVGDDYISFAHRKRVEHVSLRWVASVWERIK